MSSVGSSVATMDIINTREALYENINDIKSALLNSYIRDEDLFNGSNTYTVILSILNSVEINISTSHNTC